MVEGAGETPLSLGAKLQALALGTLLTFGIFETGLRVAGWVLQPSIEAGEARYTILCEGDSFTYGIGGNAFPDQLEDILNERAGERLFRTVNTAVPGINTTLIADDIARKIQEHDPDLVIVTTGENNSWNAIRLSLPDQSVWTTLDSYLLYSRVYKFLKVASVGWEDPNFHEGASEQMDVERAANHLTDYEESIGLPHQREEEQTDGRPTAYDKRQEDMYREAWSLSDKGQYEQANVLFGQLIEEVPTEIHGYLGLAGSLMRLDQLDEAVDVLSRALAAETEYKAPAETYFALGWALRRKDDYDGALRVWTEGLRAHPTSRKLYQTIASMHYQVHHDVWRALKVEDEVPEVRDNLLHQYLLRLSNMSEGYSSADVRDMVSESFRADMVKIATVGKTLDVPMVFSGYPTHAYREVEEVAAEFGIPYTDFRPLFASRFTSKDQFLGPDGCHCNTEGYHLMALAFADQVEASLGLSLPHSPNERVDMSPEVEGPGFEPGPRDRPRGQKPKDGMPYNGEGKLPDGPVEQGNQALPQPDGVPTGRPHSEPVTHEPL